MNNQDEETNVEEKKGYILFVYQDYGFAPKAFLAPYEDFIKVREKEYQEILDFGFKNVLINGVNVEHLLIENVIWENGCGKLDTSLPYRKVLSLISHYAEWCDALLIDEDKDWVEGSIHVQKNLFDAIDVYKEILEENDVKISHSVLVLESKNGVLRTRTPFKNVEEMFKKLYLVSKK